MVIQKRNSCVGEAAAGHSLATSQYLFSPENGSDYAAVHITHLKPGGGLDNEEVHEVSDQIFQLLDGTINVFSNGRKFCTLEAGDALLVNAGDYHALKNPGPKDATLYVITVPPLGE